MGEKKIKFRIERQNYNRIEIIKKIKKTTTTIHSKQSKQLH